MPYKHKSELPEQIRDTLPEHAQAIWKEAFNSSWESHNDEDEDSREERSVKIAWGAVKRSYYKNEDGNWVKNKD
ncbi:MAG: Cation transport regulator ChaB [candidate division WS6 bacterium OLB20]|uniref:Cation transport regulator ChaB n=1 Tax=candidate division WS6 bacterium OLB20 TaxID=1617426 RepID=A0A136LWZ0_9BACT|nr:MAG: Cation transport regulator ChaB [candidate division WS6 bacterium OLB20]